MPLTLKQKAFADYFIQYGNATEAARKAGYKHPETQGSQNLRKLSISQYIAERLSPGDEKRIADADEVMAFYSAVMRGEVKDQFGLDASLQDRIKAGDSLMKRYSVTASEKARGAMEKLDSLLEEFKNAVKSETD